MLTILLACAISALAPAPSSTIQTVSRQTVAAIPAGDVPIKRGDALGDSPVVHIDSILANPEAYADKSVTVVGDIGAVCPNKGCWMQVTSPKGKNSVRMSFKDYAFFVPLDSKGMHVKAEGEVKVQVLSKEDVEHYVGEGAKMDVRPDGTAFEVSFVAAGVELHRK